MGEFSPRRDHGDCDDKNENSVAELFGPQGSSGGAAAGAAAAGGGSHGGGARGSGDFGTAGAEGMLFERSGSPQCSGWGDEFAFASPRGDDDDAARRAASVSPPGSPRADGVGCDASFPGSA